VKEESFFPVTPNAPSDHQPNRSQQQGDIWDRRSEARGTSRFFNAARMGKEAMHSLYATPIARLCPRLSHSFTCRPPFRVGLPLWLSVLPLGCCVLYGKLGAVKPPSAATARTELCESGSVSTLVTTGLAPPAVPEERGGYSVRSRGVELPTVGAFARSPYRLRISLVVISALFDQRPESLSIRARSSGTCRVSC
jgi:hypothetical protein